MTYSGKNGQKILSKRGFIFEIMDFNRIKIVLVEKKWTNNKLAEALDISPQTVSRWCTNDQQPTVETLFKIAKALNVNVRELLVATG